ncbi:hypothetical protein C8Q80DRAFT_1274793 [Daedaleopsis nitida]|nr:hypothetical protein C8Q80DRAFT_1274793 [Daedaleopsis nitida]
MEFVRVPQRHQIPTISSSLNGEIANWPPSLEQERTEIGLEGTLSNLVESLDKRDLEALIVGGTYGGRFRLAPRLHTPQAGSSSSSRHSEDGGRSYQDPMATTVTARDFIAQTSDLRRIPSMGLSPLPIVQILDEEAPMVPADLIALDSPFMSEPPPSMLL